MLRWIWNPVLEMIVGTWRSGKRRKDDGCAGRFSAPAIWKITLFITHRSTPRELLPAIVLRPKYSFDNTFLRSYCFIRGGASVGRALWMVVLLLLGTVTCVSAIPQTDLPETCYNEVNTPVNQAPPVVPGIRFVRPSMATVVLPRQVWEARHGVGVQAPELKESYALLRRDPHSLQDLLCTFLI